MSPLQRRILAVVTRIPRGRVAGYGEIAAAAGNPRGARAVVWALRIDGVDVPWHRVVRRDGSIGLPDADGGALQRRLLSEEGVEFDVADRVVAEQRWIPPAVV